MKTTIKQWRSWTTPSKASYLGYWVGLIGTIFGIAGFSFGIYAYCYPPSSPPSNSDLFIQSQNKTKVALVGANIESWLGDSDEFLSLHFQNKSKVPAKNFHAAIYINGKQIANQYPMEFKNINLNTLTINAESSLGYPLASIREINEKLSQSICGFSTNSIINTHEKPESCFNRDITKIIPIEINYSFTTLFDEKESSTVKIWAYI